MPHTLMPKGDSPEQPVRTAQVERAKRECVRGDCPVCEHRQMPALTPAQRLIERIDGGGHHQLDLLSLGIRAYDVQVLLALKRRG